MPTLHSFPVWLKIDSSGRILCRCLALDGASARRALPCGPGESVASAASHAIGLPRALAAGRCTSCGQRPRLATVARCSVCQQIHRTAVEAASKARTGANYASRTRKPATGPRKRRAGYWSEYGARPDVRETRNAAKRAKRAAA